MRTYIDLLIGERFVRKLIIKVILKQQVITSGANKSDRFFLILFFLFLCKSRKISLKTYCFLSKILFRLILGSF